MYIYLLTWKVENKFSIISPIHDFKICTRLQHVTQPLQTVTRRADNNRMSHISGDCQRFGNEWYLLVCLSSASRTGTCRAISMQS